MTDPYLLTDTERARIVASAYAIPLLQLRRALAAATAEYDAATWRWGSGPDHGPEGLALASAVDCARVRRDAIASRLRASGLFAEAL